MTKETYNITGMSCSACSARVEKAVAKLLGEKNVSVNLLTNSMQVFYDEKNFTSQNIIDAVENSGYGASLKNSPKKNVSAEKNVDDEISEMKNRLKWSIIFLLPTIFIAMNQKFFGQENAITFSFSQFLLVLPIIYLNRKFFINGFKNLFHGAPNMDTLVGLGSMSAAVFGAFSIFQIGHGLGTQNFSLVDEYSKNLYFESSGMILTLITLGKFFESRAKGQTTRAIEKLINLSPKTANVFRDGEEKKISVDDLIVGDEIFVRPGEIFPADGIIFDGETFVDESTITGESLPVKKFIGEKVTSGTLNKNGFVKFRAEKSEKILRLKKLFLWSKRQAQVKLPSQNLPIKFPVFLFLQ